MSEGRASTADVATRAVLEAFYRRDPLVVVKSPPGGGKSGTIIRAAALGQDAGDRILIGAQSQDQSLELARSFRVLFPRIPLHFLASRERFEDSRAALDGRAISVLSRADSIPPGPVIVVANTSKWAFVKDEGVHFDAIIIDEAYQMHSALFDRIAGLGDRYLLVGDPGQIRPIVQSDIRGLRTHAGAPHRPAPEVALLRAGKHATIVNLPISRRLVDDTADIVQKVFYPSLPFGGLSTTQDRRLEPMKAIAGVGRDFLDAIESGKSLIGVRLAGAAESLVDSGAIFAIHAMIDGSIGQRIVYNGRTEVVEPRHIGVVCARAAQVSALQSVLPDGVYVETANRMQGLERPIVFAWHPVSGVFDPTDFHLEIGRLCVALSRHMVACALVYRSDVDDKLHGQIELGARSLGAHESDAAFASLRAHHALMELLRDRELAA